MNFVIRRKNRSSQRVKACVASRGIVYMLSSKKHWYKKYTGIMRYILNSDVHNTRKSVQVDNARARVNCIRLLFEYFSVCSDYSIANVASPACWQALSDARDTKIHDPNSSVSGSICLNS